MKILFKKIGVVLQAIMMTTLICFSLPVSASDIEIYKAPQSSQTTLMFMLDTSGSMRADLNDYKENRLQNLKKGMITLLQGDASQGIAPLDDKLVVGLSSFNKSTGRIKLEARPLGEPVALDGNRAVFRTVISYEQNVTRNKTTTTTTTTTQQRSQTSNSTCNGWFIVCWGGYVSTGNYKPSDASTGWIDSGSWSIPPSDSFSGWTNSGSPTQTGSVIAQECVDWNNDATYSCKTWVASTKQPSDFPGTTTTSESTTPVFGTISNGTASSGTPSQGTWGPPNSGAENCNSTNCTRTQTRTKTDSTSIITPQSTTQSYTTTTVYGGVAFETHRKKMLREVDRLVPDDSTPTGYAYAEVAAYLMGQTTKDTTGSGFYESSTGAIRDDNNYKKPTQIDSTKQCNTQGIYFLTDGQPQYYYNPQRTTLESFMKKALGAKGSNFSCSNSSSLGKRGGAYSTNGTMSYPNGWDCIGAFTQALINPNLNPSGTEIWTAVVGFGSDFSAGNGNDVKDAQDWGTLGKGGWYSGNDDKAVVNSVNAFVKKLGKYIPPVTTGSVTIPVDALDTQNIQPWGYFPQFDPKPDAIGNSGVITWLGNLKKYQVASGILKDRDSNTITNANGLLKDDINDYWADTSIKKWIEKEENGVKTSKEVKVGGALSRMLLGYNTVQMPNERSVFTDRTIKQNATNNTQNDIGAINSGNLIKLGRNDFISSSSNLYKQDPKRAYLLSLFGYAIAKDLAYNIELYPKEATYQTQLEQAIQQQPKRDWLMGAVMHSRPILLTQEGTTTYKDNILTYTNRDDLVLFGSTQGVLHVMRAGKDSTDNNAGKEVFAFVPNEIIENQSKGFLSQDNQSANLQYGIDGQWTAYTEYVTKSTSTPNAPIVTVKGGKQWVYGGLRMGGKSYYALDLSDISSSGGTPKLKFHISPSGTCSGNNPLGCMGQSWSKPTIAWVNWQGKRKLVMFVGGGYDPIYETSTDYAPSSSSTDQGAGVYMFDADDGTLLWWASANVGTGNTSTNRMYAANMNRSIVSSIKTVDRNSDGLVDHLYFGDLGGQVWRVDLSNSTKAGVKENGVNFANRVVRILNMSGSNAPRFYATPTFTIHNSNNGIFAAITIGSGNLSYPMSASSNQNDAVYVLFDKDVTRRNLAVLKDTELYTKDLAIGASGNTVIKNTDGNTSVTMANGGWYYPVGTKKRILNDHIAIDNDLYVSIFDASKDIDDVSCAGGVRGESNVSQFCLPFGQCTKLNNQGQYEKSNRPEDIFLGKGNIGISFGGLDRKRGLVLNLPTDKPLKTYTGKAKFISQRWFER
ncbi:pilus assembly protein PilY [Acinetobacter sp. WU_MDCI_Axc73]|nr:pilus assembly protein PilY [Acinetobacter sp. WU_MDCI_Axc73]